MTQPEQVVSILNLVNLRGLKTPKDDSEDILAEAVWWASLVWEEPCLGKFPDHGLDHSVRVVELAMQLAGYLEQCGGEPLHQYEKLIIALAAVFHDVGMQYGKWNMTGPHIGSRKVRRDHGMYGEALVLGAFRGDQRFGLLRRLFDKFKQIDYILSCATEVAFAHQWKRRWDELAGYPFKQPIGVSPRDFWRPRILAGLLRLADELDCTRDRLPDFLPLREATFLSEEERLHWTACYYVTAVTINTKDGISITIDWKSCQDNGDRHRRLISELLDWLRKRHLEEEIEAVKPYLASQETTENSPAGLPCFREPTLKPCRRPSKMLMPPWEGLADALGRYKLSRQELHVNLVQLPGGAPLADRVLRAAEGVDWIRDHFQLETGWHVSHYFRCRKVLADRELMLELIELLAQYIVSWRVDFICAIGTAAIKIAGLLSARTGIQFTYTFGGPHAHEYYSRFETEMWVPRKGCKLLVIDDIIGVGSVAATSVKEIRRLFKPKSITFFSLYSLGKRKDYLKTVPKIRFTYLAGMDSVSYQWPTAGRCEECDPGGPKLEREPAD